MVYDNSVKSACCSNTQSVNPVKYELATLSSTLLHRFVVISSWQRLGAVCTVMLRPLFCQLHDLSLLPGVHSTPSMMRMHAGSTGQQHRPAASPILNRLRVPSSQVHAQPKANIKRQCWSYASKNRSAHYSLEPLVPELAILSPAQRMQYL